MRRIGRQDGAAAVEFGLLLPLLVMLAFGIVEFSEAHNRSQGMQAAVREAARYAASSTTAAPVAVSEVETRFLNTLQSNEAGGFPAPGGTQANPAAQVAHDVQITVANLTAVDDTSSPPLGSTDVVCPDGVDSVRVSAEVRSDRREAYGLVLPLMPGSPYELGLETDAVFRCIG